MELTIEQQNSVREWVQQGATLADVQRLLKEQYEISMTYMDVRLLVLELAVEVQDTPDSDDDQGDDTEAAGVPESGQEDDPYAALDAQDDELDDKLGGKVSVTIDRVVAPGAMFSGSVTFSDGVTGRWMFDQMGRLGLDVSQPDYKPSEEDLADFQVALRQEMQRHGYA